MMFFVSTSSFKGSKLSYSHLIPLKKEVEGRNILTPKTPSPSLGPVVPSTFHSSAAFWWSVGQSPPHLPLPVSTSQRGNDELHHEVMGGSSSRVSDREFAIGQIEVRHRRKRLIRATNGSVYWIALLEAIATRFDMRVLAE
jgi:hypothetical protein